MTTTQYKLIKDLPFAEAGMVFTKNEYDQWCSDSDPRELNNLSQAFIAEHINNPDWFEPIPEPKPVAKYRNGAVVDELEDEKQYYFIDYMLESTSAFVISSFEWKRQYRNYYNLLLHNVFLTEEEAKTALDNLKIYNRLYKKVMEINAENKWVANWSDLYQRKYFLYYLYQYTEFRFDSHSTWQIQGTYMCQEAVDYLLSDALTDAERWVWINY
jgi:hypothetical protein